MASKKRKTSGRTAAAPRKRTAPKKKENVAPAKERAAPAMDDDLTSQMQDLGVDVVPREEIHVGESRPSSLLSDWDYHLFNEGSHHRLWEKLGAHVAQGGTIFGVWAPNAASVSVIGDWNDWNRDANPLTPHSASGIWEGFVPNVAKGAKYKFHIRSRHNDYSVDKADPFAEIGR